MNEQTDLRQIGAGEISTTLTLREVATRLGKSDKTVRRMITRGELAGAHKVATGGAGTQWVVPYATVVQIENANRVQVEPDPVAVLQSQVAQLQTDLAVMRALADERQRQLESLHLTFRALNPAPQDRRKRWRRPG